MIYNAYKLIITRNSVPVPAPEWHQSLLEQKTVFFKARFSSSFADIMLMFLTMYYNILPVCYILISWSG